MRDVRKIVRVQIFVIIIFVIGKTIRPSVLESDAPDSFKLFLLSFPNLCEGIIGVLVLTALGLYLNRIIYIKPKLIYLFAALLTALYTTTQELKIHNIGGNNVYDPNDLMYSLIGVSIGYLIILKLKPKI